MREQYGAIDASFLYQSRCSAIHRGTLPVSGFCVCWIVPKIRERMGVALLNWRTQLAKYWSAAQIRRRDC